MTRRKTLLGLAGLGFVVWLLAGCSISPISTSQTLTGQEGAVVFKLITNGSSTWDPAETLSTIAIKREPAPGATAAPYDTLILSRTREMTHSTAVFSGMVAPGRYSLSHAHGNAGITTYTFPLNGFGTFEVKKGAVSLLGTLLVQPLEGTRFQVGYVPPEAELTQTFSSVFPALAQQTRDQPVNTFEPTNELTRRASMAVLFKQMPTPYEGLHAMADGNLLAGGKMGRVIWRKAGESRWRVLQLDTWKEVLSVRIYRGGLLAAGEEGLLRFSADEGKTWQALTPPDQGLIAAAEPLPNGKVIALVRRNTTWKAYISDNPMVGRWRNVGAFEQERSMNTHRWEPVVLAGSHRAGILMANGEYVVVDGNSETIERHSVGVSIFGAQVLPDGMLVVQGGILTRSTLVSSDGGKTWTDLDTSRFMMAITFANPSTAYAIAPPGNSGGFALMVSRDGAKTWQKAGEVPTSGSTATRALLIDPSNGALLALMQNGQVMRSTDEGKTWARDL